MEVAPYVEKLVPSTCGVKIGSSVPQMSSAGFVAPCATVLGDVTIGSGASIWYGATLRGDVHKITIGEGAAIGDCAVVHVAKIGGDHPTLIGDRAVIGANAIVHACTLGAESLVGAGATVLDGATVQTHAAVAPGAVVGPGKTVPTGQLWAGVPATYQRELTEEEIAAIPADAASQAELAVVHAAECAKGYEEVFDDQLAWEDSQIRHPDYLVPDRNVENFSKQDEASNSDIGMLYNTVKQARNIRDMPILKDPKEWATSTKQDHHTKLGEDPSAKRTDDGRATW